jgi:hypothetical protein
MWVIQSWVLYALIFIIVQLFFIIFLIFKLNVMLDKKVPTFPEEQSNAVLAAQIDALEAKDKVTDAEVEALKAEDVKQNEYDAIQDAHIENLEKHEGAIPAAAETPVVGDKPVVDASVTE